jgi:hypothetical protein
MARDLNDAYAVLGLRPGADAEAVAAAYRDRAKALHPDRAGDDAAARMAAVNAAHDVLTAALLNGLGDAARPPGPDARAPSPPAPAAARTPGDWLTADTRRALGRELLAELSDGEAVVAVARAATWASPHTVLALTERRLVWLLDDAVAGRVRSLRFDQVAEVSATTGGRLRRRGSLRVRPRFGRPTTFADLPADVAPVLGARIRAAMSS